ncbi:hypothetical protein KI387_018020, partial [Taxus chinensis]
FEHSIFLPFQSLITLHLRPLLWVSFGSVPQRPSPSWECCQLFSDISGENQNKDGYQTCSRLGTGAAFEEF